jgi:HlyD family secretion protein
MKGSTFWVLLLALLAGGGVLGWQAYQGRLNALPTGFAAGNGRVESVQVDVTTKEPGRVETILVHEGDMVHAGQVVARMDTVTLKAELARAQAIVAEQEAKVPEVDADIAQAESQLRLAEVEAKREHALFARKASSREDVDIKDTLVKTRRAVHDGNKARLNTVQKSVEAAKAEAAKIQTRIDDMTLKATVEGRVLYRLAEEGEVLGSGGKVLTLVNLGDVYMEIYLPAQDAVKAKIGADARIVLDVASEYAARAKVTFIAPEAQFTPKQVETRSERDKLMFRVKLSVPPERILPVIERIKTGIRGVGYVRLDDSAAWPGQLDRPFPQPPPVPSPAAAKPEGGKAAEGQGAAPETPPVPPPAAAKPEGGKAAEGQGAAPETPAPQS